MDTSNRRTNVPEESSKLEGMSEAAQEKLEQAGELIAQQGQHIQESVAAASEAAQNLLQAAGEQMTNCARATDESIRKHPYQALGIVLGAGVLCGYLLSRK
ncbi:MAG: DUF883 family protein [Verrucomicrobia bacterium]|nr:DUF883 family protein [Verrucomicrobiota bacterium]